MYSCFTLQKILEKQMTVEDFKKNYWNKKTLFIKNAISKHEIEKFITKNEFEKALLENDPKWKWNASWKLPDEILYNFERGKSSHPTLLAINGGQAEQCRKAGAYIFTQGQHKHHLPTAIFTTSISNLLNNPTDRLLSSIFQIDNTLNTPNEKGFELHNDPLEIYCLHLLGKKSWTVDSASFYKKILVATLNRVGFVHMNPADTGEIFPWEEVEQYINLKTYEMEPGDFLYLPTYTLHKTKCIGNYSLSLNVLRQIGNVFTFTSKLLEKLSDEDFYELSNLNPLPEDLGARKELIINHLSKVVDYLRKVEDEQFHLASEVVTSSSVDSLKIKAEFNTDNEFNASSIVEFNNTQIISFSSQFDNTNKNMTRMFSCSDRNYSFDNPKYFPLLDLLKSGEPFSCNQIVKNSPLKWSKNEKAELLDNIKTLVSHGVLLISESMTTQKTIEAAS